MIVVMTMTVVTTGVVIGNKEVFMGKRSARKKAKKRYAYYANRGREMPAKTVKYHYTEDTSSNSYTGGSDDYYRRQQQIIDDVAACIPPMITTMM